MECFGRGKKISLGGELAGIMRDELIGPDSKIGHKLPPVRALASRYGVSSLTAGKAIQKLSDQGWIRKRQGSGIYIAKVPESSKKTAGYSDNSRKIGWVVPEMGMIIPQIVLEGVSNVLHRKGYKLEIGLHHNDIAQERAQLLSMFERDIEGAVMYCGGFKNRTEYLGNELRDFPIVITDNYLPNMKRPHVVMDNAEAGREITEYLISEGCEKIAFIQFSSDFRHTSVEERIKGYHKALVDHGLMGHYEHVAMFNPTVYDNGEGALSRVLEQLFAENEPDAIISINDFFVPEIISFAETQGLSVPGDLHVAGFDNLYHINTEYQWPTSSPDFKRMGERAAEFLLEIIRADDLDNTSGLILPCPVITHEESHIRLRKQDQQRKIEALVGTNRNRRSAVRGTAMI